MRLLSRQKIVIILMIVTSFMGVSFICYPSVSAWFSEQNATEATEAYHKHVSTLTPEELESEWKAAEEYNDSLKGDPVQDPFMAGSGRVMPSNYTEILDLGEGIMGYLVIPSIRVDLPIYHGTFDDVLSKGVGHIRETALPIGGKGLRPVLTGHTGLPSATLFNDLIKLKKDDEFFIFVLDKVFAYRVSEISIVEPTDIATLNAVADKEQVTLLTCTPYGVNSHRLLVTGDRSDLSFDGEKPVAGNSLIPYILLALYCAVPVVAVAVVAFRKPKQKRSRQS